VASSEEEALRLDRFRAVLEEAAGIAPYLEGFNNPDRITREGYANGITDCEQGLRVASPRYQSMCIPPV
jgi:hypothetical protein